MHLSRRSSVRPYQVSAARGEFPLNNSAFKYYEYSGLAKRLADTFCQCKKRLTLSSPVLTRWWWSTLRSTVPSSKRLSRTAVALTVSCQRVCCVGAFWVTFKRNATLSTATTSWRQPTLRTKSSFATSPTSTARLTATTKLQYFRTQFL